MKLGLTTRIMSRSLLPLLLAACTVPHVRAFAIGTLRVRTNAFVSCTARRPKDGFMLPATAPYRSTLSSSFRGGGSLVSSLFWQGESRQGDLVLWMIWCCDWQGVVGWPGTITVVELPPGSASQVHLTSLPPSLPSLSSHPTPPLSRLRPVP